MLPPIVAPGGLTVDEIYALFPNLKERAQNRAWHAAVRRRAADAGDRADPAHRRKMLLLDEPTEGLAPVIVQQIGRTIREIKIVALPCCWWNKISASRRRWPTVTT